MPFLFLTDTDTPICRSVPSWLLLLSLWVINFPTLQRTPSFCFFFWSPNSIHCLQNFGLFKFRSKKFPIIKHSPKLLIFLGPRPPYAGEIWKSSFISMVRPTVHTNPSRKRNFSKTLFKQVEFENAGFDARFKLDEKHFVNEAFRKRWRYDSYGIPLPQFSSNTNTKWPVIVAFSNFSDVVWTENFWGVCRVKLCFQIPPA